MDLQTELTFGRLYNMAITTNVTIDEDTDVDMKAEYIMSLLEDDYHVRIQGPYSNCGIIALPGDSVESVKYTIHLAKQRY